jgi:hypothetical protein
VCVLRRSTQFGHKSNEHILRRIEFFAGHRRSDDSFESLASLQDALLAALPVAERLVHKPTLGPCTNLVVVPSLE